MRLFISINFDEKTKDNILAVQSRLKKMGRGRFSAPENLHLTLAFLGEVEEERVEELKSILDSLNTEQMTLRFSHTGCFRGSGELWWIGLDRNEALLRLQKELIRKLCEAGFSPDRKTFKPHITLAREMHIGTADSRELLPSPFSARTGAVSLMLSHRPGGKLTYTELYRKNING